MATDYKPLGQSSFGKGMINVLEPTDIPDDACVYAQNVEIGTNGAISPRKGCSLHGNRTTGDGRILGTFVAKLRSGDEIPIRHRSDPTNNKSVLDWYNPQLNEWELLFDPGAPLNVDARMGFVQWNTSSEDRTYMCNGVEAYIKFLCITNYVVSNTATTVTLNDASDFPSAGDVIIDGVVYAYSGKSTNTLTGLVGVPALTAGEGVAISPTNPSIATAPPRSNVLIAHASRLWVGKNSTMAYSKTGDPEDFGAATPRVPGDGGIEDFPEGGGDITGFASRDELLIVMKNDIIRTFQFDQKDISTNEIPVSRPLGFSSNIGPRSFSSVTTLLKEVFYTSRRYGLRQLTQTINAAANSSNPALDIVPLTDAILPITKGLDFGDGVSAAFDEKILAACKSDPLNTGNDLIVVYDFRVKGIVLYRGWNVGGFYEYNGDLYYGSSTEPNCFKCFDGYSDDGGPLEIIYKTKRWNYGAPAMRKSTPLIFINGRIADGTDIEVVTDLDEDGTTKQVPKTIEWDGEYVSESAPSTLGSEELGLSPLAGAVDEHEELNPFKVYLTMPISYHYNMQMTLRCTSPGARFKIYTLAPNPAAHREPPAARKI